MDILVLIIFLLLTPYLLVPLTVTRFYKKKNYKVLTDTYWISGVIIFLYPFIFFSLCSLGEQPTEHGRCYTGEANFLILNTIFMLPLTMIIQWASNKTVDLSSRISKTDS